MNSLRLTVFAALCSLASVAAAGEETLIPRNATWSFLDDGSDLGSAWTAPAFDDSAWDSGPAHLGYGDDDEHTMVGFGPDPDAKYTTTYFRHDFDVVDPSAFTMLRLKLVRDDGAVVSINGTEVARSAMPAGPITATTFASATASDSEEDIFYYFTLDTTTLVPGNNVMAVEVHQRSLGSSDISFEAELVATDGSSFVSRGPYLQLGTPTSVTVRWRTTGLTTGLVRYGLSPTQLNESGAAPFIGIDQSVTLDGLSPDTTYYYSIGTATETFLGGTAEYSFTTSPLPATQTPVRILAVGDSGTADALAALVRDTYVDFAGGVPPDLWLMLGDNAYTDGSDAEYQSAVFEMYRDLLRQSVVWPTRGNHENSAGVYYGAFTMPTLGEAGGMASGSEAYYSFDYANVHFVCLDSDQTNPQVGGAMWTWLEADLMATDQDWIIAFWHHPPYTKGSHDSDTEDTLVDMRELIVPLIEDHGVDLVLNGHSHSFERTFLIDGHYGVSNTFVESMKVDGGDGDPLGSGPYDKLLGPHTGTVYCVAGSSGKLSDGPLDHPAMAYSTMTLGAVVIDVDGATMDVSFLDGFGQISDTFTLRYPELIPWTDLGEALAGLAGEPRLDGFGTLAVGEPVTLTLDDGVPSQTTTLIIGLSTLFAPVKGGVLVPTLDLLLPLPMNAMGSTTLATTWPTGVPSGLDLYFQAWHPDAVGIKGFAASNALRATTP